MRRGYYLLVLSAVIFIFLSTPALNMAQSSSDTTHLLSIDQLETDDYYLGISYLQIRSKADDSLVYEGYVMNLTLILSKTEHLESREVGRYIPIETDGLSFARLEKVSEDMGRLSFSDIRRREDFDSILIPLDPEFDICKVVFDGVGTHPAEWDLEEGEYVFTAEGYTNEREDDFEDLDKEYPDFLFERTISLDSDKEISLDFEPEYGFTIYEKSILWLGDNTNWFFGSVVSLHLVLTFYILYVTVDLDYLEEDKLKEKWEFIRYNLVLASPALVLFVLMFFTYTYREVWTYGMIPPIYYYYRLMFFISMPIVFFLKKFDLSSLRKKKLLTNMLIIYGTGMLFLLLYHFYWWSRFNGPACYAAMTEPWKPKISKSILLVPFFRNKVKKKKLKEELKEEGIYKEEWDEI